MKYRAAWYPVKMSKAPARYPRHKLPALPDGFESKGMEDQRCAWVQALPDLGFDLVFDRRFSALEAHLAWMHDRATGRAHGLREKPQQLWIQVWRHGAGALSSVVRFSHDNEQWLYSSIDLAAMEHHGFVPRVVGAGRHGSDGSVSTMIKGADKNNISGETMDSAWAQVVEAAALGRLVPIDQWPSLPLPHGIFESLAPGLDGHLHLHRPETGSIDTPMARSETAAAIIGEHGAAMIQAWEDDIEQMPASMGRQEKDLWLAHMKVRLEIALRRSPVALEVRTDLDPVMQGLVGKMIEYAADSQRQYDRASLMGVLQERLVMVLASQGMEPGDPLEPVERQTTSAWLAALTHDEGDPTDAVARADGMVLGRFGMHFPQLMFEAARDEGVVDKIKAWIGQQSGERLVEACTQLALYGWSLPMHLGRAWMQARNSRHCPDKEARRIDAVRECLKMLGDACPIEQWTWATDKASVWNCALGQEINLPIDQDLAGPHRDRLIGFCQWMDESGVIAPSVIFMPGQTEPIDLLDDQALSAGIDQALADGLLFRNGTAMQRIELMAPVTAFVLHADMRGRVGSPATGVQPRMGARF